jgi:hypothetical protein
MLASCLIFQCLERILYVWAIRHPASGYVQGINDLATPFFEVFLSAYVGMWFCQQTRSKYMTMTQKTITDTDPEEIDPSVLPPAVLNAVEADSFWCLSRLLDGIQDNYITAQPGIQRSVKRMAELVARIDAPLSEHLAAQGVEFMQFAFRWMNCLLMREISVKNTVRMWDTYLVRPRSAFDKSNDGWMDLSLYDQAEGPDAFSQFHLYVCSAFLTRWSEKLREMDFQVCRSLSLSSRSISHVASSETIGHHYVPTVVANTRLDGPRNRDAPQPSVCAKFDLAQRTEPLHGKVKVQTSLYFTVKVPLPTSAHSFLQGTPTHNTNQPRGQSAVI